VLWWIRLRNNTRVITEYVRRKRPGDTAAVYQCIIIFIYIYVHCNVYDIIIFTYFRSPRFWYNVLRNNLPLFICRYYLLTDDFVSVISADIVRQSWKDVTRGSSRQRHYIIRTRFQTAVNACRLRDTGYSCLKNEWLVPKPTSIWTLNSQNSLTLLSQLDY